MTNPTQPADGMPEPLACPFCGHVGLSFSDGSTYRWGIASCDGCGASAGDTRREYPDTGKWHAEAIKQWNERAAPKAPPMPELPEPTCWALTSQLKERETTCSGRMWFVNPGNSAWQPIYTADQLREYARQCVLAARGFTKE